MNEGRFPEGGRFTFSFVFLDFTCTCREQPFRHTKSKASAYEQLNFHGKVIGMLVVFFRL